MDAIETVDEAEGLTVKLFYDVDPTSPDDWDTLTTLEHSSGFSIGTPTDAPSRTWGVYARWLTLSGTAVAALPVRLDSRGPQAEIYEVEYDPSFANGVAYVTDKRLTELCGDGAEYHTREWARKALLGELEVWKQYFEGDVYGYVVEDEQGNHVDSCWGFYGFEYAQGEARDALKSAVEQRRERRVEIARGWALAHGLGTTSP